jgi:hypothetical protein
MTKQNPIGVVARNYRQASDWAERVGLLRDEWVYLCSPQQGLGHQLSAILRVGTYLERPDWKEILDAAAVRLAPHAEERKQKIADQLFDLLRQATALARDGQDYGDPIEQVRALKRQDPLAKLVLWEMTERLRSDSHSGENLKSK